MYSMKLTKTCLFIFFTFSILSGPVSSGPFSEKLGECFVRSTTNSDKNQLMRWMYILLAEHPVIKKDYNIAERDKVTADIAVADIVTNLFTRSCAKETNEAVKYEGEEAFSYSFELLGKVAAVGMFSDPNVSAASERYMKYIDMEQFLVSTE